MNINIDEELKHMDEIQASSDSKINEAFSLNDPITTLKFRYHPIVKHNTTLQSVIRILKKEKVGCVMVEKNGKLIGVMTERDFLLRIIGKDVDLSKEKINDYMTKNPESLHDNDPVSFAFNKMHVLGIRHIPIINDENEILGMVSVKDVITHIGNYFGYEIVNLPPEPQRNPQPKAESA